jgi:hypothetical protein
MPEELAPRLEKIRKSLEEKKKALEDAKAGKPAKETEKLEAQVKSLEMLLAKQERVERHRQRYVLKAREAGLKNELETLKSRDKPGSITKLQEAMFLAKKRKASLNAQLETVEQKILAATSPADAEKPKTEKTKLEKSLESEEARFGEATEALKAARKRLDALPEEILKLQGERRSLEAKDLEEYTARVKERGGFTVKGMLKRRKDMIAQYEELQERMLQARENNRITEAENLAPQVEHARQEIREASEKLLKWAKEDLEYEVDDVLAAGNAPPESKADIENHRKDLLKTGQEIQEQTEKLLTPRTASKEKEEQQARQEREARKSPTDLFGLVPEETEKPVPLAAAEPALKEAEMRQWQDTGVAFLRRGKGLHNRPRIIALDKEEVPIFYMDLDGTRITRKDVKAEDRQEMAGKKREDRKEEIARKATKLLDSYVDAAKELLEEPDTIAALDSDTRKKHLESIRTLRGKAVNAAVETGAEIVRGEVTASDAMARFDKELDAIKAQVDKETAGIEKAVATFQSAKEKAVTEAVVKTAEVAEMRDLVQNAASALQVIRPDRPELAERRALAAAAKAAFDAFTDSMAKQNLSSLTVSERNRAVARLSTTLADAKKALDTLAVDAPPELAEHVAQASVSIEEAAATLENWRSEKQRDELADWRKVKEALKTPRTGLKESALKAFAGTPKEEQVKENLEMLARAVGNEENSAAAVVLQEMSEIVREAEKEGLTGPELLQLKKRLGETENLETLALPLALERLKKRTGNMSELAAEILKTVRAREVEKARALVSTNQVIAAAAEAEKKRREAEEKLGQIEEKDAPIRQRLAELVQRREELLKRIQETTAKIEKAAQQSRDAEEKLRAPDNVINKEVEGLVAQGKVKDRVDYIKKLQETRDRKPDAETSALEKLRAALTNVNIEMSEHANALASAAEMKKLQGIIEETKGAERVRAVLKEDPKQISVEVRKYNEWAQQLQAAQERLKLSTEALSDETKTEGILVNLEEAEKVFKEFDEQQEKGDIEPEDPLAKKLAEMREHRAGLRKESNVMGGQFVTLMARSIDQETKEPLDIEEALENASEESLWKQLEGKETDPAEPHLKLAEKYKGRERSLAAALRFLEKPEVAEAIEGARFAARERSASGLKLSELIRNAQRLDKEELADRLMNEFKSHRALVPAVKLYDKEAAAQLAGAIVRGKQFIAKTKKEKKDLEEWAEDQLGNTPRKIAENGIQHYGDDKDLSYALNEIGRHEAAKHARGLLFSRRQGLEPQLAELGKEATPQKVEELMARFPRQHESLRAALEYHKHPLAEHVKKALDEPAKPGAELRLEHHLRI